MGAKTVLWMHVAPLIHRFIGIRGSIPFIRCNSTAARMFCPECGTLAFPDEKGIILCPNGRCDYMGETKTDIMLESGERIDLSEAKSKAEASDLKHLRETIDDSDQYHGVLTNGSYLCPKCECDSVYAELKQTRASDEPETRFLTCAECRHGWREY